MTEERYESDDILYIRFLTGETEQYDQLMLRYGDSLTMYLYGYLHDWEEAEDLMIEAFARIMAKRPRIRDGAFKAYLYKTARNLALRSRSRRQRVHTFSIDGMEQEVADQVLHKAASDGETSVGSGGSPGSHAEEAFRRAEQRQALHLCLDRIEPELKEALWLIYFEELTYAQAAEIMGVKPKRIDRLLFRGKEQMRKELAKEGVTNAYE